MKEGIKMIYAQEQFKYSYKIASFLNEKRICKEDIISIYSDGNLHYLIYLKEYNKQKSKFWR